jgi:FKBP-type peptidyl-prolyl cis-trans isomerase FklB
MAYRNTLATVFLLAAVSTNAMAAELQSIEERLSYIVGTQMGQQMKTQGIPFDKDAFMMAIEDAMAGNPPRLSQEEIQQAVTAYQQQRQEHAKVVAETNKKAGEAFLASNAKKPGVKVTGSGLQYQVLEEGKGASPSATDTVVVNYRGTLLDGTEFDSSYKRGQPATFPVNGVIPGWQEALQMMKPGAKWKIFVPANLAYGERGAGATIGPNATLTFEVELLEVKAPAAQ